MTDGEWVTRPSRIERVEVFRRGAEVTRHVALSAGDARVRVAALPLELDDASVVVERAGQGALRVRALRVALEVQEAPSASRHPEPEALRALRRELRALSLERQSIEAQKTHIEAIGLAVRPTIEPGVRPAPAPDRARLALLGLQQSLRREARERLQQIDQTQRARERTLHTLVEEHAAQSSDVPLERRVLKAVELELEGVDAEALLVLRYRVSSARWAPSYRLAHDSRTGRAVLAMNAVIAQRTGEDWPDVALALSTARMDGWFDLPELASLRIGRAQPPSPRRGYRALPEGGEALFDDHDRALGSARPATHAERFAALAHEEADGSFGSVAFAAVAFSAAAPPPPNMPAPPPVGAPAMAPSFGAPSSGASSGGAPPGGAPRVRQAKMAVAAAPKLAPEAAKRGGALASMPARHLDEHDDAELSVGGGGGYDDGAPDMHDDMPGAAHAPTRELLDFGRLRLAGPQDTERGQLRARDAEALALEGLDESARDTKRAAIGAALHELRVRSAALTSLSAPALHSYPEALLGFDHRYDARSRVEVPSDGSFHTVSVTDAEGPATLRHVGVPGEDPAVYRTLRLSNPLEGAVLHGPVDISLDGALVVSGTITPTPAGGALTVGMGIDESVKLARNLRFREESAGLMGGSVHLVHELDIEVRNTGAQAIRLEVRERVPVTAKGEDEIEVRTGAVAPAWQEHVQDDPPLEGGKRWVIDLESGAHTTLRAEYTVRIAAKNELVGGNRRP